MTDGIKRFFDFARERHHIYLRKQAGLETLTEDPILARYRFTNVFRELDRTTVWFRENVREKITGPDILLATVVFRWFNRIATGEAIFKQESLGLGGEKDGETAWDYLVRTGDVSSMRASCLQYCGNGPYVTGAYIIKTPDGYSKLDGVLKCIEWFMERQPEFRCGPVQRSQIDWQELAEYLVKYSGEMTLESVWQWLRQFPFLGDFMAYEIVTDLRWTPLLDRAPDIMTWANPGPGAARGLGRVFADNKDRWSQKDKVPLIVLMQSLLRASQDAGYWSQQLPIRDEDLGWYTDNCEYDRRFQDLGAWPSWEMREVEHTLCEYDKYERARLGEGRPRGTYR